MRQRGKRPLVCTCMSTPKSYMLVSLVSRNQISSADLFVGSLFLSLLYELRAAPSSRSLSQEAFHFYSCLPLLKQAFHSLTGLPIITIERFILPLGVCSIYASPCILCHETLDLKLCPLDLQLCTLHLVPRKLRNRNFDRWMFWCWGLVPTVFSGLFDTTCSLRRVSYQGFLVAWGFKIVRIMFRVCVCVFAQ